MAPHCPRYIFGIAFHLKVAAPADDIHPIMLFDQTYIFVKVAEQGNRLFHTIDADDLFRHKAVFPLRQPAQQDGRRQIYPMFLSAFILYQFCFAMSLHIINKFLSSISSLPLFFCLLYPEIRCRFR